MPNIKVGDIKFNTNSLKEEILKANSMGAKICVAPEFSITSNNLHNLFNDKNIINSCFESLYDLIVFSTELDILLFVNLPLMIDNNVYETTAIIKSGNLLGIVPRKHFSNNSINEYFKPFKQSILEYTFRDEYRNLSYTCPISSNLIFANNLLSISVSYDEEVKMPSDIVVNMTDIPETVFVDKKIKKIRDFSTHCIIISAGQNMTESTEKYAYFGRAVICENEEVIAKNEILTNNILISDVDLDKIDYNNRFDNKNKYEKTTFTFDNYISNSPAEKIYREFDKTPYINKKVNSYNYSMHILNILAVSLAKRITVTKSKNIVIGVSGGLDSTIALLIANKTIDLLSFNSKNILAYSMPGFGTQDSTNTNIANLLKSLNIDLNVIDIKNTVASHFNDIDHDINNTNTTFENAQARERTQILMDIANDKNGLVVGTGDLSEIALGYSTYNGDQMSMYNVNGSLYKTLIKYILNTIAEENIKTKNNILLANTLKNILHSPISPELLPTDNGIITQKTEEIIGDYLIHDFIIYNYLKYNYDINKLFDLTLRTFVYNNNDNNYSEEYIRNCINIFFDRFFKSQFKRSASPDFIDIGLPNLNSKFNYKIPTDFEATFSI